MENINNVPKARKKRFTEIGKNIKVLALVGLGIVIGTSFLYSYQLYVQLGDFIKQSVVLSLTRLRYRTLLRLLLLEFRKILQHRLRGKQLKIQLKEQQEKRTLKMQIYFYEQQSANQVLTLVLRMEYQVQQDYFSI